MKPISFDKYNFESMKDFNSIIKEKIRSSPRNLEFEDEFLLAVINNLHEDVKKRNYKVTKLKILDYNGQVGEWEFCRDRFRGGIYTIGFFEPIKKWHGVTLYPHKRRNKVKEKLILSLRQKWSESVKKRDDNTSCQICGDPCPELHHSNISFKEIALECLKCFTEEELENGIGEDWWLHENESDCLSNEHPAVKKMFELHSKVEYQWLCNDCHLKEHSKKLED